MKILKLYFFCLTSLIVIKWSYVILFDNQIKVLEAKKGEVLDFIILLLVIAPAIETLIFQVLLYILFKSRIVVFMFFSCVSFSFWHYNPDGNVEFYIMYFFTAIIYNVFFLKVSDNKWVAFAFTALLHAVYNGSAFLYNTFLEPYEFFA